MSGFATVQSSRLYQQIVAQIKLQIVNGTLKVGDRLPTERELAEQFQVSRTSVREATKILQQEGLIAVYPGRGTFIVDSVSRSFQDSLGLIISIEQTRGLDNLIEVREMIEPEIAALAAVRATQEDIKLMHKAVSAMDKTLHDADAFIAADLSFHLALADATQNTLIPMLLDPIVDQLQDQRKAIFLVKGGAERGQYHHKHILDAVSKGDPAASREAMRAHLQQIRVDSEAASLAERDGA